MMLIKRSETSRIKTSYYYDDQERLHFERGPAVSRIDLMDAIANKTEYLWRDDGIFIPKCEWWLEGIKCAETLQEWEDFLILTFLPEEDRVVIKLMQD